MGGKMTTEKYIYVDTDNAPLFTKERYVKKDGSKGYAYSHIVNGETIKTMPQFEAGTKLYNLHRLAKYPTAQIIHATRIFARSLNKAKTISRHQRRRTK